MAEENVRVNKISQKPNFTQVGMFLKQVLPPEVQDQKFSSFAEFKKQNPIFAGGFQPSAEQKNSEINPE